MNGPPNARRSPRLRATLVRSAIGVSAAAAGAVARAAAQVVTGVVVEDPTDEPIAGAYVALVAEDGEIVVRGLSGARGEFTLTAPADGPYFVRAARLGYAGGSAGPLDLTGRGPTTVRLRLEIAAVRLDSITVTTEPRVRSLADAGFYRRRERERGFFFTGAEIEERRPHRMTDLLSQVPGVDLRRVNTAFDIHEPQVGRTTRLGDGMPCYPRVFLDGVETGAGGRMRNDIDALVDPTQVQGVELYRTPAEVPVRFGGSHALCGVIVIWTKKGR